jgi:hypothetical protein
MYGACVVITSGDCAPCCLQEKYDLALCNFRAAANIHPRSSVLACYCGMALSKLGLHDQALDKLQVGAGGVSDAYG